MAVFGFVLLLGLFLLWSCGVVAVVVGVKMYILVRESEKRLLHCSFQRFSPAEKGCRKVKRRRQHWWLMCEKIK